MKAAIYDRAGGPEVLRYVDLPDPTPADDELLVRVEAISLEGGDLLTRQKVDPAAHPYIPGYAASGEVVALGSRVTGFAVGQKVTTFAFQGSHAELRAAPAATSWVVPDGMDMKTAATIPCGPGTAALALDLGRVAAGETVLVLGAAGGVGLAAVQLARAAGARVIGTGTSAASLEALRPYGLSDAIVVGDRPVSEQVLSLLGGQGVHLLIDNVGGAALQDAIVAVREGGRAVLVGAFGGFGPFLDTGLVVFRRLTVTGCVLGAVMAEPPIHRLVARVIEQAAAGALAAPIDAVFPLSEAAKAHARAEERGRVGRVVLVP